MSKLSILTSKGFYPVRMVQAGYVSSYARQRKLEHMRGKPKIILDGINHPNGKPIRFRDTDKVYNYLESHGHGSPKTWTFLEG